MEELLAAGLVVQTGKRPLKIQVPTSTTWSMSLTEMPASCSTLLNGVRQRPSRSEVISSKCDVADVGLHDLHAGALAGVGEGDLGAYGVGFGECAVGVA